MRTLVTGRQMKAIDEYTIHTIGIPSLVLMERAALCVVQAVEEACSKRDVIWAACGSGNNGADGVAVARMLWLKGYKARILFVGNPEKGTDELKIQLQIASRLGVPVIAWRDREEKSCDVLIDAIFGVGLGRKIEGEYRECMECLSTMDIRLRVAVDVPSGIHGDTGAVMGVALKADITVTFGWEKTGTALYPGRGYGGRIIVSDIGFPQTALEAVRRAQEPQGEGAWQSPLYPGSDEGANLAFPSDSHMDWGFYAVTCEEADLKRIPGRPADSNKGTFGKVLIAAGSRNMCGAAYLSALAAYRTGAGLVKILTVEANRPILQELLPEAILVVYEPEQFMEGRDESRKMIEEQMNWADVVVLGPGLSSGPHVEYLVEDILASAFVPVVIDADGLNAIASHPYLTGYYTENIIITPHPGEMARLTGESVASIKENLAGAAMEYAGRYGLTCVLKDAATVVAGRDGGIYINSSGNSAMAKAGSGDVLTGIIAGLIAIGMDQEEAAVMGVYLHGRAGDAAANGRRHSLLASELADCIGTAMEPAT